MDVAAALYTSDTFWSGAGVVVGVLSAVTAVWVTFTVGFPRRRLLYKMQAAAPERTHGDPKVRRRGKLLSDPQELTIKLISRGRRDISNDAYNGGEPIRLNVGTPIISLLELATWPPHLPKPKVVIDGTIVEIGPSLIGKRHNISVRVLVAGGNPALTCESPLIDVQISRLSDAPPMVIFIPAIILAFGGIVVAMVLAIASPFNLGLSVAIVFADFVFVIGLAFVAFLRYG